MSYLLAFFFCGLICLIGQIIYDRTSLTPGHITSMFVCFGAVLDLFGWYDWCIQIFHAGALLPITSFGHSLMHGAMSMSEEYGLLGIAMGMFNLTAAGITSAILFAFLTSLFFKPRS